MKLKQLNLAKQDSISKTESPLYKALDLWSLHTWRTPKSIECLHFVYPMHLNPDVRRPIHEVFGEDLTKYSNFFFIEPPSTWSLSI